MLELGDRVNHVAFVDVNVSDAERSRRFYEATMPLETTARIDGSAPLPGSDAGEARFVGYALRSQTQLGDYPTIRLIEWISPAPVGRPYLSHGNVGWYRLVATVREIEAARENVVSHGGDPFTETSSGLLLMYGPTVEPNPYRTFHAHDPDGITIQWSYDWPREDQGRKGAAGDATARPSRPATAPIQDRMFALVGGTTDVEQSVRFFTDVLGFDLWAALQTPEPVPNIYSPGGGLTACDGGFFVPRGDRRFVIDWLRWFESSANPVPYAEPNHLGIIRCGIEVDDIDRAYEALSEAARSDNSPVGSVSPVEIWRMGADLGDQRVVNFTNAEGVMFQLVAARPYALGTLHPWGADAVNFAAASVEQSTRR